MLHVGQYWTHGLWKENAMELPLRSRFEFLAILTSGISTFLGSGIHLYLLRQEPPKPRKKPSSEPPSATVNEPIEPAI